jgi:thymidylate synthase ThyX
VTPYAAEHFTEEERRLLGRYFSNLDGPVFALVNLPEVVKGALFARYSRSSKSLRRLFLDEFAGELDMEGDLTLDATIGLRRAEELYERVFLEYGDDSVAQLGGVHLACEQASNLLTKVLERSRLMAYLEQSTRYVPYDSRLSTGHYRYRRDADILESPFGARYVGDMDRMFDTYAALLRELQRHLTARHPKTAEVSDFAYRQSVRAAALDALRGLLPAGALSNVGIYGSGQSFELLLLHMRADPLPEARQYADMMLEELRKVIPSFLVRVDRPDRGGEWSEYLASARDATAALVEELWPPERAQPGPSVTLLDHDPDGELRVLAAMCFPHGDAPAAELERRVHELPDGERARLFRTYVGDRRNRRHRPGRAFERTGYRFEIVSDYGAFRDLQRHRMLTVEWQPLGTGLGYEVPELVEEAGLGDAYVASMERSRALHESLAPSFPRQAAYAVALGFNVRYVMQLSAREAMHVVELRSAPQGHASYRRIAQEMHRLIEHQAGHRLIAEAMRFVDHGDAGLGRLESERRNEARRTARATPPPPPAAVPVEPLDAGRASGLH